MRGKEDKRGISFLNNKKIGSDHLPLTLCIKNAQNGNQGAFQAYSIFRQVPVTGLIGAFLITFFQILNLRA